MDSRRPARSPPDSDAANLRAASPLFLRDAEVRQGIELFFFANQHLWRAVDAGLAAAGLGRAHFRALYFIARRPGLNIGELQQLLGISKQALGRVMGALTARGLVDVRPGSTDRRQRELRVSAAGAALEAEFFAALRAQMGRAYSAAGQTAVTGFWQVAAALVPPGDRRNITAILSAEPPPGRAV